METTVQLPNGLEELNDAKLAAAREVTAHLTAADLRNIGEPTIIDLPNGHQTKYHFYPVDDAEGTIFFYQAVNQNMTPQAMAQVYAMQALLKRNVIVFPQNCIEFEHADTKKIRSGDFSPYGEVRLRGIEHALGRTAVDGDVTLAGFSFGATDATASAKVIAEQQALAIGTLIVAEPANIAKRSLARLSKDFLSTNTQDLIHAVQAADMPALTELYAIRESGKSSPYLQKDLVNFVRNFVKPENGNFNAARGLRKATLGPALDGVFKAMAEDGLVLLHEDTNSRLTPEGALDKIYSRLQSVLDQHPEDNPNNAELAMIKTSTENEQGHAIGDNPWAWSSIVRTAIERVVIKED